MHTLSENIRELPARITDSGAGVTPLDQSYAWGADGDPTTITDYTASGYTRNMGYDGLDRLFDVSAALYPGNHHQDYVYDPLDNIRSLARGGISPVGWAAKPSK